MHDASGAIAQGLPVSSDCVHAAVMTNKLASLMQLEGAEHTTQQQALLGTE
jgi:hypothetical protein